MRGILIAIEGVDGAGKSTLARALADATGAHLTREPFTIKYRDGVIANDRASVIADRALHVEMMDRLRDEGQHVITDRYYMSTAAYGNDPDVMRDHGSIFGAPDMWIVLSRDPHQCLRVIKERGEKVDADAMYRTAAFYLRAPQFVLPTGARLVHLVGLDADTSFAVALAAVNALISEREKNNGGGE